MRERTLRWGSSSSVVRAVLTHPRVVALLVVALLLLAAGTGDVAAAPIDGTELPPLDSAGTTDKGTIRAGP